MQKELDILITHRSFTYMPLASTSFDTHIPPFFRINLNKYLEQQLLLE